MPDGEKIGQSCPLEKGYSYPVYLGLCLAVFACLGPLPGPSKPVGVLALGLNYLIALVGGGGESVVVQVLWLHSGALIRAHLLSEAPRTIPNVAPAHQCLPVDLLLPRCREAGGHLPNQPVNSALL